MQLQAEAVLGYWPFCGNGQVLRYLLSYVDAIWREKTYTDKSQWFERDKEQLGFKFPNLPYLIDGPNFLTETSSLIRYIPKRWGYPQLLGKTILDQQLVDTMLGVLEDIWQQVKPLMFIENWKEQMEEVESRISPFLECLENQVGQEWSLGYLTVVDFRMADFVQLTYEIFPNVRPNIKKLLNIKQNLYNLPQVKDYRYREGAILDLIPSDSTLPIQQGNDMST